MDPDSTTTHNIPSNTLNDKALEEVAGPLDPDYNWNASPKPVAEEMAEKKWAMDAKELVHSSPIRPPNQNVASDSGWNQESTPREQKPR